MKLKNPNFFISKTRLQVRNVPLEMDQKQLKRVFFDAVKQRATQANPKGERVQEECPLDASNVQLLDPETGKGTRKRKDDNKKVEA